MMVHSSTIRSALAALLAAAASLAVVAGPIAPVADAAKNTGRYKTRAEATRKKQRQCKALETSYDNLVLLAEQAGEENNAKNFNESIDNAQKTYDNAKSAGCAWAARVAPPQKPSRAGAVTTLGPVVAAPLQTQTQTAVRAGAITTTTGPVVAVLSGR